MGSHPQPSSYFLSTYPQSTVMPKHLKLVEHLTSEEIYQRYRSAKNPVERTHWQIIWLKAQNKSTNQIAQITGYSAVWVRQVMHRYNEVGPEGLVDQRRFNPGATPLIDEETQNELIKALEGPAPDGGHWNSRKVAEWIAAKTGREEVHAQRGWEYLRRLGFRQLRPRQWKQANK